MLYQITHNMPSTHPNIVLLEAGIRELQGPNDWAHIFQNSWLVDTPVKTAQEVYELLMAALDSETFLLVTTFDPDRSAGRLPEETRQWILQRRGRNQLA